MQFFQRLYQFLNAFLCSTSGVLSAVTQHTERPPEVKVVHTRTSAVQCVPVCKSGNSRVSARAWCHSQDSRAMQSASANGERVMEREEDGDRIGDGNVSGLSTVQ
ncbi:hypothetical protein M3J09_009534 [Ascochyta lentis]